MNIFKRLKLFQKRKTTTNQISNQLDLVLAMLERLTIIENKIDGITQVLSKVTELDNGLTEIYKKFDNLTTELKAVNMFIYNDVKGVMLELKKRDVPVTNGYSTKR